MHEIYNGTPYATQKLRSIQLVGTLTHEQHVNVPYVTALAIETLQDKVIR